MEKEKMSGMETEVAGEEVAVEMEAVNLTEHLRIMADDLMAISLHEEEKERKAEFFRGIGEELETVASELNQDMEFFEQEVPEKVSEVCQDIDKNLLDCQNAFLDAIEAMQDFIKSEDPELIKTAKKLINEAEEKMKQGDLLQEQLESMFEEQGFTI